MLPNSAFHVFTTACTNNLWYFLFSNPIDCSACVPECPVEAIFEEDDLTDGQEHWVDINEERSQETPNITDTLEPLEGAEDKREALGL